MNVFRYGEHILLADGREIHLTQTEADILAVLARHYGRVVSYETIISSVWPLDADMPGNPKTNLHVQVMHLRQKIEGTGLQVETEHGLGMRVTGEISVDGTIR